MAAPEQSDARAEPARTPSELLIEALEHLPPEQRQRVTAWVLARMSGVSYTGWSARRERDELLSTLPQDAGELRALYADPFGGGSLAAHQGHQVVPVRLPAELHARLRQWSTEHGFSMATVVRGLVARFLDGQAPAP